MNAVTLQRYFYCYSLPLEVGSVILPGNWGRILRTYTPQAQQNSWLLTRELIYEMVRTKSFSHKPSRFEGIFLCLTEAALAHFRQSANRPIDLGYEVELVNPNAPSHMGDWDLAAIPNTANVLTIESRAALYWQGANLQNAELLTLSPIRITRVLP